MIKQKTDKQTIQKLNFLFQKTKKTKFYKQKFKGLKLPIKIQTYEDWLQIPLISPMDFYNYPITSDVAYLKKSRPNHLGEEAIIPLNFKDYLHSINHDLYKFKKIGVKKEHKSTIVDFTITETLIMAQALINMGTKYIAVEGNSEMIARDLSKKKVNFLFTNYRMLEKIIRIFKDLNLKSYLEIVSVAGEQIQDKKDLKRRVKKILGAKFFDSIGTREVAAYALQCSEECEDYHLLTDSFFFEVIDPKTKKMSQNGELVITPYWREDLPLLRFATGDLVKLKKSLCLCKYKGELSFGGILGRVNDNEKISNFMLPLAELYEKARISLLFQNKYLDSFLWDIFPPLDCFVLIVKSSRGGRVLVLVEKFKSLLFFRRKQFIVKAISNDIACDISVIRIDRNTFSQVKKMSKTGYLDLRYKKKSQYPSYLKSILDNLILR